MCFPRRRPGDGFRPLRSLLWTAVTGAVVAAALLDVRYGTFRQPDTGTLLGVSAAVTALSLPALLAPAGRGARPGVIVCPGGAAAVASLACSVGLHLSGREASASSAYGAFEPVALLVVLAVTARRGMPVPAAVVTVGLLAAVIARPLALHVHEGSVIVSFVLTLVAVAVAGASVAARLVEADRRQREHRIRLHQRVDLARELHDFVAHHVTGIVVQAQGAQAVAAKRPDLVVPALERIERTGAEALVSLRRMVGQLRAEDGEMPLVAPVEIRGLRTLVADFRMRGVSSQLIEDGPTETLPPEVAAVVHRVTMESLTNVRKHAHDCRDVRVRVQVLPQRTVVEITNDGTARRATADGYGLKGLRERVTGVGGTFRAGATADGGWLVRACLPLAPAGTDGP
ncbi:sensor histidine kinase [Streptomyces hirsutus]|uniref:sensor histidine kinase n=1 Tax=Streptomyces hirsutus TaxID=35620 RepID=UPI00368ADD00